MFLDAQGGGLNMVNILHFTQAKQIKSIYKNLTAEYENWNAIGISWLKCLDGKFGMEYFVSRCSCLKKSKQYLSSQSFMSKLFIHGFSIKASSKHSIVRQF